jgi:hypothetical protein
MAFRSSGKRRRTGCIATLSFISGIETSQKNPLHPINLALACLEVQYPKPVE